MPNRLKYIFPLLILIFTGCGEFSNTVKKIPISDFFNDPFRTDYNISPNGNYVSYLQKDSILFNIYLKNINNGDDKKLTNVNEKSVQYHFWVNDSIMVYAHDIYNTGGVQLVSLNINSGKTVTLNKDLKEYAKLSNFLQNDPKHIALLLSYSDGRAGGLYKVNVINGEKSLIYESTSSAEWLILDNDGKLRMRYVTEGVNTNIYYTNNSGKNFKLLMTVPYTDDFWVEGFDENSHYGYVASNVNNDMLNLYKYDFENNKVVEELFSHSEVDITEPIQLAYSNRLVGVKFTTDQTRYKFFYSQYQALYNTLKEELPGYQFNFINTNRDENIVLFKAYNEKNPGVYYVFNMETESFVNVGSEKPWLKENEMSTMKPITFRAADGLTLHGYLSIPVGRDAYKLPVVVYPHGGPLLRDKKEFREEIQFLTNRGYAVFFVNYRGSNGYGKSFRERGFKEWGGKMQSDIADGVKWLIEQNIADKDKVVVMGYSFGGFSALAQVTYYPELYKGGISYAGLANLFSFMDIVPENYRPIFHEIVGNPETDSTMLRKQSPYFHYEKVKLPLLIAQGAMDKKVPRDDIDVYVARLKKQGNYVDYMVKEDEGHGYIKEENKIEFFTKVEQFLELTIKGKPIHE